MILLPAIDLMGGQVVRLRRGEAAEKTVYSDDPVAWARKWQEAGARWLHLVDLDAAFSGVSANLNSVRAICEAVDIPCELGGGMRDIEAVHAAFDAGVRRVVLGTRACESLQAVRAMCQEFGGERIAVGIDSRDGKVAIKGWRETTSLSATGLALAAQDAGVRTIIATDIATDGMLTGPNLPALQELGELLECDLIASGGVSSLQDLRNLAALGCLHGAIVGKALYDGHIPTPFPEI